MKSYLTISYYAKYRAKMRQFQHHCPLCSLNLMDVKEPSKKNSIVAHLRDHHYKESDLWFAEDEYNVSELQHTIVKIWQLEYEISTIKLIDMILCENSIGNKSAIELQICILNNDLKKLRQKAIELTS